MIVSYFQGDPPHTHDFMGYGGHVHTICNSQNESKTSTSNYAVPDPWESSVEMFRNIF